jgi:hypothetical protein
MRCQVQCRNTYGLAWSDNQFKLKPLVIATDRNRCARTARVSEVPHTRLLQRIGQTLNGRRPIRIVIEEKVDVDADRLPRHIGQHRRHIDGNQILGVRRRWGGEEYS